MNSLDSIASKFREKELIKRLDKISVSLDALLQQKSEIDNIKQEINTLKGNQPGYIIASINEIAQNKDVLKSIGEMVKSAMSASDEYYKETYFDKSGQIDWSNMMPEIMKEVLVNEMFFIFNKNGVFGKVIENLAIDILKESGIIQEIQDQSSEHTNKLDPNS